MDWNDGSGEHGHWTDWVDGSNWIHRVQRCDGIHRSDWNDGGGKYCNRSYGMDGSDWRSEYGHRTYGMDGSDGV